MASRSLIDEARDSLGDLIPADSCYAIQFVDSLLTFGKRANVSDVHLQPTEDGLQIRWRMDGVLQDVGTFPRGDAADVVTRLKVLAGLLTYRSDVPQEGRIRNGVSDVEMRVSTFPTFPGERAVVRLFASEGLYLHLNDLGLGDDVGERLEQLLTETSGAVLITGAAGSGKTTTAYACLRHLVRSGEGGRSIVSLEDPIEVAVPGVAQSQANEAAGFGLASGLRSLMRQDPEVILLGEIRDRETAEIAIQASLTGQLVITTFHAGSAAGAISRLSDMGIEPYLLRSGVLGILSQRLVRRLCDCAVEDANEDARLGLPVLRSRTAVGCPKCSGTGYRGRIALAELLVTDRTELGRAVLSRMDAASLEQLAVKAGMVTRWQRAMKAVQDGLTSAAEVRRVLGFSDPGV